MKKVARADMEPLIITVAITGASGKEENPNVPETPEEQARDALRCYQAGAVSLHVHAKDETGAKGSADPARYREINRRIRELCPDIIIGNTTGVGFGGIQRQDAVKILDGEPEMCSINMGPLCARRVFKERKPPLAGRPKGYEEEIIFAYSLSDQERIAQKAKEKGIKPELEIHDFSMFYAAQNLISKGLVKSPYWMQLIFSPNRMPPTMKVMATAIELLPPDSAFSCIGIGPFQLPIAVMAIMAGGHVRVGLEDNLYYQKGQLASNAQLVERVVRMAKELGRKIATPAEAREMLGLSPTPSRY